jgi:hypothetical protein
VAHKSLGHLFLKLINHILLHPINLFHDVSFEGTRYSTKIHHLGSSDHGRENGKYIFYLIKTIVLPFLEGGRTAKHPTPPILSTSLTEKLHQAWSLLENTEDVC